MMSGPSKVMTTEALAAASWSDPDMIEQLRAAFPSYGVEAPAGLVQERVDKIRAALSRLAIRWRSLLPKGALGLGFQPAAPRHGVPALLAE